MVQSLVSIIRKTWVPVQSWQLGTSYLCFLSPNFLLCKIRTAAAAAKSIQSCLTLCNPIDGSPPGSPIPGILQARTLESVAISFSSACRHSKSLQSYLTLCDPMDSSLPGSSVHQILQARILEGIAISFSEIRAMATNSVAVKILWNN